MSDQPSDSLAFDRAAEYYDQTRGFPSGVERTIAELFVTSGGLHAGSRVLEIGIGTGRIALPLAQHVQEIVGVDLSRRMMGRLLEKQSAEPIMLVEADATKLPFESRSFDAAVAVHIFHLIPGWQDAVHELSRVLKPEGVLLAGQNEHGGINPAFRPLREAWDSALPPKLPRRVGVPEEKSETFLTDLGWKAVRDASLRFTMQQSPMEYFHRLEHRLYSDSWLISDAEHQRALAALTRALAENYTQPEAPITIGTGFEIRAYQPPQ